MASILKVDTLKDTSDNTLLSSSSGNVSISNDLIVDTDTLFVDSSTNLVGIGTSSPSKKLHSVVSSSGSLETALALQNANAVNGTETALDFSSNTSFVATARISSARDGSGLHSLRFSTYNLGLSERMRIDSSGNVLVGTTNTDPAFNNVVGQSFAGTGQIQVTRDGGTGLLVNRKTSNGELVSFRKDGATVGSISAQDDVTINIDGGGARAGIVFVSLAWFPRRNGALVDNTLDLGSGSYRFDDIFATNGTIQTSDQNEKQSIQLLTSSEIAVAKRISKLFKTFKFNSAVEEKGDNARTHTGIIAQDVQQAFTDEGLDASNYALFISDTWWEKDKTIIGNDGNETTEKQTWKTEEEAEEGSVQKTRLGIRYPELLSFVSSAFEQRLTNIETRLEALENA